MTDLFNPLTTFANNRSSQLQKFLKASVYDILKKNYPVCSVTIKSILAQLDYTVNLVPSNQSVCITIYLHHPLTFPLINEPGAQTPDNGF